MILDKTGYKEQLNRPPSFVVLVISLVHKSYYSPFYDSYLIYALLQLRSCVACAPTNPNGVDLAYHD